MKQATEIIERLPEQPLFTSGSNSRINNFYDSYTLRNPQSKTQTGYSYSHKPTMNYGTSLYRQNKPPTLVFMGYFASIINGLLIQPKNVVSTIPNTTIRKKPIYLLK